jgi:hypothetical protein
MINVCNKKDTHPVIKSSGIGKILFGSFVGKKNIQSRADDRDKYVMVTIKAKSSIWQGGTN